MGDLVNRLGQKAAGQLIKSEDWNALVAAVETMEVTLTKRIDTLSQSVDERFKQATEQLTALDAKLTGEVQNLSGRITTLKTEVDELSEKIDPVLKQFWRVTLEATRSNFVIGEVAEITARVTDLQGKPLTVRPWIDVVVTWGQLSAASGFESLSGEGNRSVSVRTDASGIAKIRLRSEYTHGLREEAQAEIATAFTAVLTTNNKSVGETILASKTPMEARAAGAFKLMTKEYDRPDTRQMRSYVDTYYMRNAHRIGTSLTSVDLTGISWIDDDYRSTVMAFVKSDSDPQTPDATRAVSSTQITFRDWIRPWLHLEYMDEVENRPLVEIYRDRLKPRVTGDFVKSMDLIRTEVKEIVRDRGLIGKQRDYKVLHEALDSLNVAQPPPFMNILTQSVQDAVRIQQTVESSQATTLGLRDQEVAFNVFTNTAARVDTNVTGVTEQVGKIKQQLDDTQRNFNDLNGRFTTLQNVTDKVSKLELSIKDIDGSVKTHGTTLTTLQQNFNRVDSNLKTLDTSFTGFRGKVEPVFAQGGTLETLRSKVDNVSDKVEVLKGFNVIEVQNQLAELRNVRDNVRQNIEQLGAVNNDIRLVKNRLNIPG